MENALKKYLTPRQFLLFWVIIFFGLFLRWYDIGSRPLHHDESIHAMFGKYFYDHPETNFYKYNPEYHGPTLYLLLRQAYIAFGATDGTARAPIALIGSLMLFFPLLFRSYLKPWAFLFLTGALALSPTLIYWSRFAREDFIVIAGQCMVLWGVVKAAPERKAFWVLTGIGINWATKANVFVFLALIAGFLIYEALIAQFHNNFKSSHLYGVISYSKKHALNCIVGIVIATFIYTFFITTGFRNMPGFLDALYRESIKYWYEKHDIERISGPFNFHLYELCFYEYIFVLGFVLHFIHFYVSRGIKFSSYGLAMVILAFSAYLYYDSNPLFSTVEGEAKPHYGFFLWGILKLKDAKDVFGAILLLIHPLFLTTSLLLERKRVLGFWGYFFTASLFTYSFLGEKVPWLSTYALLPGIVFLTLYFEEAFKNFSEISIGYVVGFLGVGLTLLGMLFSITDGFDANRPYFYFGAFFFAVSFINKETKMLPRVCAGTFFIVLLGLMQLRNAWLTNNVSEDRELGLISQVHTTVEFKETMLDLRKKLQQKPFGRETKVHISGEPVWPGTWYLKDTEGYSYADVTQEQFKEYDYLVRTYKEDEQIPEGFVRKRITLRGWWVPDYSMMTFKNFFKMMYGHFPWNGTGYTYAWVYINKNVL